MTINKEAESRADAPSYFSVFYQISYIRGMELIHYPPFFSVHTTPHFFILLLQSCQTLYSRHPW